MKNSLIILAMLFALTTCQSVTISTSCTCAQMLTEADCTRKSGCSWDATKKTCAIPSTPTTPTAETYAVYCDQYTVGTDCAKDSPCAWNGTVCTHFTGCTAFTYTEDAKCQEVSTRCITDGVHCVEKAACLTYKTQKACVTNSSGRYCYWNLTDAANPKCEDADDCPKLPTALNTDALCRAQISKCTTTAAGGCIESAVKCADQIDEQGCVQNKDRSQACFWTSGKCWDKTCDNALTSLTTDDACKTFLSTCTPKQGGGCVTRTTCSVAIQAACVKDNTGADCFWNGTACVNKTCTNALATNKTNASCQTYLSKCITTGAGCVDNTGCDAAKIKDACDKTLSGAQCHWDGTACKPKTCTNAGSSYAGHDQCTTFMATCTANGATGCQDRTCLNASTTNNTNDLCKTYLPNGNCITKTGGGCKVNTTCENIDIDIACVTDASGKTCFWDSGSCKTKTCANSPAANNTHPLCQQFLTTCTVGSGSTCVDKTCENIQAEENCSTDLNNKPCTYKGKCYKKQCSLASKSITTHDDCQAYLSTCTLDNSGSGCMDLPLRCEAITNTNACKIKAGRGKCGLQGTSCVDQSCATALVDGTSYTTTNACKSYKTGCVVNNNLDGCMDLPTTCGARQKSENCDVEVPAKCQWDGSGNTCIDIKCENAHVVTLKGNVSQAGCWVYKDLNCVVNSAGDKCAPRPASCAGLSEDACKFNNVVVGDKDCYWDAPSTSCKDYACTSITFAQGTTPAHSDCYNAQSQTCTINAATPTGCVALKACNQYTFEGQCIKDADGNDCVYDSVAKTCNDKACGNAGDTDTFSDDAECQTFSKKCTVIQKKCTIKKATCAEYSNQAACDMHTINRKQQCTWNSGTGACDNATSFDCTKVIGTGLTDGYCNALNFTCIANGNGTACAVVDCAAATAPFDLTHCQAYHSSCTVKLDGSACVLMAADCATTNVADCTKAKEGLCHKIGTACTYKETTALTTCTDVASAKNLTADYCKGISNNACSVLANQEGCVAKGDTCADYTSTLANCFSAINEPKCIVNSTADGCIAFNDATGACADIKINGVTTYSDYLCQLFKASCKSNSGNTACEDNADYTPPVVVNPITDCTTVAEADLTFAKCQNKLSTCSVNAAKTKCVVAKNTCAEYTVMTDCAYAVNEGECIVSGTAPNQTCIQKSCDGAALTITDMNGCQTYTSNCVLRAGGCSGRGACASYLLEAACVKDSTGKDCLWNPTTAKCVDKTCTAAEASTNYNTHDKCSAIGSCTVKANQDKTVAQGCIARAACNTYVNSEQCKFNNAATPGVCVWNENDSNNKFCADKSCSTAPLSITTHGGCTGYLAGCTVNIVDDNGTPSPKGCTPFKPCSQYAEAQCDTSSEKDTDNVVIACAWNGTACANKSCATAQTTVNTATTCANYWAGCTVNATDDGCIVIPDKCEGMTKNQCFTDSVDSKGRKCYWLDDTTGCVTKSCDNSPNYATDTECDTYLSGCTTDAVKCKTKICEDFPLTTDALCKAALASGTCTTNGNNCVTRGTCAQAQVEAGCVTDSNGKLCQWMTPVNQTAYCTIRTCATAPSTLTTEEQCKQYFTPTTGSCTTKKDGGCTVKGACTSATVEAACKTDSTGADCWWDTDKCRPKECKDFSGSTHSACQKFRSNCTAGLNGKCALMANCEATTVRAACVVGSNGPCLWINGYVNADGSKGACFKYDSCKSLTWNVDNKCKWISSNCTTDGTQCVGITSCTETNINGGCKTGTDGQCIQTVSAKGANDTICKKYSSCDAAYYLTHEECYSANPNCTSDYTNGCIALAACSTYTKQGQCNFNKDGPVKDANGYITSTGNCVWDTTATACKDEQCKDIALTTEWECSARLKTCSTDGTTCIVKGACNSYTTDNACNKAGGTEGACFWVVAVDTTPASCRTKTCADIPNGTSTAVCTGVTNCVSNGTNCIAKAACSAYTTKTGCMSSGTDGLCVWTEPVAPATQGKCALMTGCASAKDETTCSQASNRCSWNATTKVCGEHTCDTYKTQVGSCKFFYTWDMKKYNICSTKDGKCVATEATTLAEGDCYTLTAYQYSWNPTSSKCAQCGTVVPDNNNSNNTGNNTNGTTTDSGYILAWTSAVLAYLVL